MQVHSGEADILSALASPLFYFAEHADNITVQSSDRSAYEKWWLLDVFVDQGTQAVSKGNGSLGKMAEPAPQDVIIVRL
ncbi:hypothetical protein BGZ63DRAFT_243369 [Mariannaea sp. PMI_226]|nr:hypothetical protein BGZ63DRAFT_243369 [Mariannaea sp. PMI_226]